MNAEALAALLLNAANNQNTPLSGEDPQMKSLAAAYLWQQHLQQTGVMNATPAQPSAQMNPTTAALAMLTTQNRNQEALLRAAATQLAMRGQHSLLPAQGESASTENPQAKLLELQRQQKEMELQRLLQLQREQPQREEEPGGSKKKKAVPEEGEEEGKAVGPESSVVPCRARGMPMDHNFKTAYFVISPSIKHGEELICSYEDCRKVGIKFRYCAHCKVPVAKRNFQKRHKHGGEDVEGDDVDSLDEADPRENEERALPGTDHISSIVSFQNMSLHKTAEEDFTSSISSSNDAPEAPEGEKPLTEPPKQPEPSCTLTSEQIQSLQVKEWRLLLLERPPSTRKEELSRWLLKVLAVSDREQFTKSLISDNTPLIDPQHLLPILPLLQSAPRKTGKRPREEPPKKKPKKSSKQSKPSKQDHPTKDIIPDDSTARSGKGKSGSKPKSSD